MHISNYYAFQLKPILVSWEVLDLLCGNQFTPAVVSSHEYYNYSWFCIVHSYLDSKSDFFKLANHSVSLTQTLFSSVCPSYRFWRDWLAIKYVSPRSVRPVCHLYIFPMDSIIAKTRAPSLTHSNTWRPGSTRRRYGVFTFSLHVLWALDV